MVSVPCLPLAGQSVVHTLVITNTGNVRLRDVAITTTLTTSQGAQALSSYTCTATGGTATSLTPSARDLLHSGVLTCTATYTFDTVATIEAGSLSFDTTVAAAGVSPDVTVPTQTVVVVNSPRLLLTLDSAACSATAPLPDNFAGTTA